MELKSDVIHHYLRPKKAFPHVWCSGCGLGVILGSMIRSIHSLGLSKDDIVVCSGIGCSSRLPVYVDFNTLHTTHGRAIAFATGVKAANPRLKVIVVTGDGDCLAIGGNHFIHACRRNIDITVILANNWIYGMTGGQFSPTTPTEKKGSTAPYGNIEQPFDACKLGTAAGASYVARSTVYHVDQMDKLITGALNHRGFSLIEVLSNCHTYFGRWNKEGDPVQMLTHLKKSALPVQAWDKVPEEKRAGKFVTGLLHESNVEEFCDKYTRLSERLKQEAGVR
jgi:2-oxoglutarate ferredoxin oxidoreductase subunit beta